MCNLLSKFYEWFFFAESAAEESMSKKAFKDLKADYIDPYIKEILNHASTHAMEKPNFLTPQQKTELEALLNDPAPESLWRRLPAKSTLANIDTASPDKVEKNIARAKSAFPIETYGTLGDLIAAVNMTKMGKKTAVHTVKDIESLLQNLIYTKVINQIALSGRSAITGTEVPTFATDDLAGRALETEKKEKDIITAQKFYECLRRIFAQEAGKYEKIISSELGKINNISEGQFSELLPTGKKVKYRTSLFSDLKVNSFIYFVLKFLEEKNPSGNFIFSDTDINDLVSWENMLVKKIIKHPEFMQFLQNQIKKDSASVPVQGLLIGTLLTAYNLALDKALKAGSVKNVKSVFAQSALAKGNKKIEDLLENLADAKIGGDIQNVTATAKTPDIMDDVAAGTDIDSILNIKAGDINYPFARSLDPKYSSAVVYLNKLKNRPQRNPGESLASFHRREEQHFTLGTDENGEPIILYDDDECDELLSKLEAASKI